MKHKKRMFSKQTRPGALAWVGVAVGISLVDYLLIRKRYPSMSDLFNLALHKPFKKWPVTIAWMILTLHLFSSMFPDKVLVWFKKFDPLANLFNLLTEQLGYDKIEL